MNYKALIPVPGKSLHFEIRIWSESVYPGLAHRWIRCFLLFSGADGRWYIARFDTFISSACSLRASEETGISHLISINGLKFLQDNPAHAFSQWELYNPLIFFVSFYNSPSKTLAPQGLWEKIIQLFNQNYSKYFSESKESRSKKHFPRCAILGTLPADLAPERQNAGCTRYGLSARSRSVPHNHCEAPSFSPLDRRNLCILQRLWPPWPRFLTKCKVLRPAPGEIPAFCKGFVPLSPISLQIVRFWGHPR